MKVFTDEMLKEIKDGMSTLRMTMDVTEYSMSAEWLEALIARLSAAEEFIRLGSQEQSVNPIELKQAEEAWLKSAGREGR